METRALYCSACDRTVRVVVVHPPDVTATTDPGAFVCTECGDGCTGALCSITQVPPASMRSRRVSLQRPGD